mgnify:FL=1
MIGNFKRQGTVSCKGKPKTYDHDFKSFSDGIIVPYGIYDVGANTGYLTLGVSHDTAEFVCDNFIHIWQQFLQWKYPNAHTICILCDGGGSNVCSHHIVKQALMKLASTIGVNIIMVHYPPYCSKYNPIEHCMFGPISRSWSGAPLLSIENARTRAEATVTKKGLSIIATINQERMKRKDPLKNLTNQTRANVSFLMMSSPKGTISSNVALNRRKLQKLFFTHYIIRIFV